MDYYKIPKTVNRYRFEPHYVNFEKVRGLDIDRARLKALQCDVFKKFNSDLVVYIDTPNDTGRFGIATLGAIDDTFAKYPLIKEFEVKNIDCFCIRSFHPARFGGHLEIMIRESSGREVEFFNPIIENIRYDIWDWCVDRYVVKPMTAISKLTGIRIGELTKEFEP